MPSLLSTSLPADRKDRGGGLSAYNISIYNNLVNIQIKNWLKEAIEREQRESIKTWVEIEGDNQQFFEDAMRDYIYSTYNEGEEQKKYRLQNAIDKTNVIVAKIHELDKEVEFYKIVRDVPMDVYYKQIESRSVNDLVIEFGKRYELPIA